MSSCRPLGVLFLTFCVSVAGCASRVTNDPLPQGLRFDPRPLERAGQQESMPGDWTRVDRVSPGTTLEVGRRDGTLVDGACSVSLTGTLFVSGCASRVAADPFSSGLRFGPPPVQPALQDGAALGNWDAVERLAPGTGIVVRRTDGSDLRGDFENANADGIRLRTGDGDETLVPQSMVQEVRAERDDGNWNGTLIGAGAGVGGSLLILEGVQSGTSDDLLGTGWAVVPFVLGAVGGVLGWGIDEAHKGADVIYRAP